APVAPGRRLQVRLDHSEEVADLGGQQGTVLEPDPLGPTLQMDVYPAIPFEAISSLEALIGRRRGRAEGRPGETSGGYEQDGKTRTVHHRGPPNGFMAVRPSRPARVHSKSRPMTGKGWASRRRPFGYPET